MNFKELKQTIGLALICTFFGGILGVLISGLLLLLWEVFVPSMAVGEPTTQTTINTIRMWSSIFTMWWVKNNGLPGNN